VREGVGWRNSTGEAGDNITLTEGSTPAASVSEEGKD